MSALPPVAPGVSTVVVLRTEIRHILHQFSGQTQYQLPLLHHPHDHQPALSQAFRNPQVELRRKDVPAHCCHPHPRPTCVLCAAVSERVLEAKGLEVVCALLICPPRTVVRCRGTVNPQGSQVWVHEGRGMGSQIGTRGPAHYLLWRVVPASLRALTTCSDLHLWLLLFAASQARPR